jgi:hypothetical protein
MDTILATKISKATVFLHSSTQLNHILESYEMHNLNIDFENSISILRISPVTTVMDNQSLPILLWPNCLWKLSNFSGSYLALKKELIAHFLVFF